MNNRKIIVASVEPVSTGFLSVSSVRLSHSTPSGDMSPFVTREVMNRGNAAAVLVYDRISESVLLVEEFRIGNLAAGMIADDCWSLGPIAGMIDEGETSLECVLREAREETGILLEEKDVIGPLRYMSSPGGTSEILDVFVAFADVSSHDASRISNDPGEYTRPVVMSMNELRDMMMRKPCPASLVASVFLLQNSLSGSEPRNGGQS